MLSYKNKEVYLVIVNFTELNISVRFENDFSKKYALNPKGTLNFYKPDIFSDKNKTASTLLDAIIEVTGSDNNTTKQAEFLERMSAYYTEIEQNKYKLWKLTPKTIKWPIRIPCYPVGEDQWIGVVDTELIMEFRKAQLIRYNQNAQRVMKRIVTKDRSEYVISINKKALGEIEACFKDRIFIPNTWTFNIPDDVEFDYKYDKDDKELVFNSIDCFDIIDGYHRFLAACRVYDDDNSFNLPIELRITRFSDEKARDFIRQEDHKTKMLKIDSESLDSHSPANFIVDRLNSNSQSNLNGIIKRNGDIINYSVLSSCLTKNYFKNEKPNKKELIQDYQFIEEFYNRLTDKDLTLLEKEWDYVYTLSTVLFLKYLTDNAKKIEKNVITKLDYNKIVHDLGMYYIETVPKQRQYASVSLSSERFDKLMKFLDYKIANC